MKDGDPLIPKRVEERWRQWSQCDSDIDERRLRAKLLGSLPDRLKRPRARFVLAAAAASLLAVTIGLQSTRQPPITLEPEPQPVIYETGDNVVLILREGKEPIYVVTDSTTTTYGEE